METYFSIWLTVIMCAMIGLFPALFFQGTKTRGFYIHLCIGALAGLGGGYLSFFCGVGVDGVSSLPGVWVYAFLAALYTCLAKAFLEDLNNS